MVLEHDGAAAHRGDRPVPGQRSAGGLELDDPLCGLGGPDPRGNLLTGRGGQRAELFQLLGRGEGLRGVVLGHGCSVVAAVRSEAAMVAHGQAHQPRPRTPPYTQPGPGSPASPSGTVRCTAVSADLWPEPTVAPVRLAGCAIEATVPRVGGPSGNRALRVLGASGGGSRWSDLRSAGVGRRELAAAVGAGLVSRVGTGGYVLPGAPTAVVAAIRHSSAVGCISALDHRGLNLLTSPTRPHLVPARARSDRRVVWHARARCDDLAVSVPVALAQMGVCRPRVETLVALDAAVRAGRVDPDEVLAASRSRDRGDLLWALSHLDTRAESVLESALRAHLVAAGVQRIALQVELDGIGRVDMLIDGWLVVEADGFEDHATRAGYRADRRRGVAGVVGGWVTLRFGYEDITLRSAAVTTAVLATLARHRRGVFRTAPST